MGGPAGLHLYVLASEIFGKLLSSAQGPLLQAVPRMRGIPGKRPRDVLRGLLGASEGQYQ
jgi:hypothetical protein